jgi:hypothetical protein
MMISDEMLIRIVTLYRRWLTFMAMKHTVLLMVLPEEPGKLGLS